MTVLYLYAELMGYQIPILKEYVNKFNAKVYVVHDVSGKLSKYELPNLDSLSFYDKDSFTDRSLKEFVRNLNPSIVYISGWRYKEYLKIVLMLRRQNIPVVVGFDDIWFNTFRQKIASIFFPIIKTFFFSHAWVAGPYQFEYAKRLGFKNDEIIFNCLSADVKLFENGYTNAKFKKEEHYPHKFLFVGRFNKVKALDILLKTWKEIKNLRKDWKLTLIGNGPLQEELSGTEDIEIIDFMQPNELVNKLHEFGCLILPSRKEQWSIVLHEFAIAGFPIICSDACGAAPVFVVPGINGYTFRTDDVNDLKLKLLKIMNTPDNVLNKMSVSSHSLGYRITPQICAASFISVLNQQEEY